jgi:pimeloyl-ACP methyl ester carboxylesterase
MDAPGCPFKVEPLSLAIAKAHFDREAVLGEFHNGRTLCRYVTWGHGPDLLCIPGLADDARSFLPLLAYLSQRYRCIAYDWPTGHRGEGSARSYRHDDFLADFFALTDHLELQKVALVGYSFGSTILLRALQTQPQRFPQGVLIGGFARRRLSPAEVLLASWARYWPGRVEQIPIVERILEMGRQESLERREKAMWQYYVERNGSLPIAALAQRARVLHQVDLRSILGKIRQPVLLICGDADPLVGKQCEAELLTGLPRVARVELSECGHLAIYTHPEQVAELISEFVTAGPTADWDSLVAHP